MKLSYIVWIITKKCNLSCLHCYARLYENERELTIEEREKLAKEICELDVPHVSISGGEPLLLPDIFKIISILRDSGIDVSIVTNGTVLTEEIVKKLNRFDVYVYLSVDGIQETHERLRGRGTWQKVVKALELLHKENVQYGTVMAISNLNYEVADRYVEFVINYEPDSINVIPVMPSGRARESMTYVDVEHVRTSLEKLHDVAERLGVNIRVWCLPCLHAYLKSRRLVAYCCRLLRVIDISPGGRLLLCDVTNLEVTRWTPGRLQTCVEEYFSNSLVRAVLENIPEECKDCPHVEYCRGGCYARAFLMFNDFRRRDPLCPLVH